MDPNLWSPVTVTLLHLYRFGESSFSSSLSPLKKEGTIGEPVLSPVKFKTVSIFRGDFLDVIEPGIRVK